jgi:hypothetical protein
MLLLPLLVIAIDRLKASTMLTLIRMAQALGQGVERAYPPAMF